MRVHPPHTSSLLPAAAHRHVRLPPSGFPLASRCARRASLPQAAPLPPAAHGVPHSLRLPRLSYLCSCSTSLRPSLYALVGPWPVISSLQRRTEVLRWAGPLAVHSGRCPGRRRQGLWRRPVHTERELHCPWCWQSRADLSATMCGTNGQLSFITAPWRLQAQQPRSRCCIQQTGAGGGWHTPQHTRAGMRPPLAAHCCLGVPQHGALRHRPHLSSCSHLKGSLSRHMVSMAISSMSLHGQGASKHDQPGQSRSMPVNADMVSQGGAASAGALALKAAAAAKRRCTPPAGPPLHAPHVQCTCTPCPTHLHAPHVQRLALDHGRLQTRTCSSTSCSH
jgi:hypothetical protein